MKILDYSSIYKISINNTGEVKMFELNIKHVVSFLSLSLFIFLAIGSGNDNEGVEEDISDKTAEIKVSASEMYRDYENNEVGAEDKYKDKVIEVSGKVVDIKTNSFDDDELSVHLQGGKYDFNFVRCNFSKNHKEAAKKLQKGDKVTIKGKGAKKVMSPTLDGCSIVK